MANTVTFSVVSGGAPAAGFDSTEVARELSRMLGIEPEQARRMVTSRQVLKGNLALPEAEGLSRKLAGLGLSTEIQRHDPQAFRSHLTLELEPIEDQAARAEPPAPSAPDITTCPKCGHRQPEAEQCSNCGVYFHKLQAEDSGAPVAARQTSPASAVERAQDGDSLRGHALLAAAVAALIGAFVWKFIAVVFEYELGIIAWGIGAAVGLAAAAFGSRGHTAGVACGILALVAILGGKYLVVEAIQAEFAEAILAVEGGEGEGLRPIYEEQLYDAEAFATEVTDEASLREFMVGHNYSEALAPDDVGAEEIDVFNEFARPQLTLMVQTQPSYEEWRASALEEIGGVSTMGVVKDSLGLLDLIFLVLGIGTAYRLGAQRETA